MANVFDQFDVAAPPASKPSTNVFDQFDVKAQAAAPVTAPKVGPGPTTTAIPATPEIQQILAEQNAGLPRPQNQQIVNRLNRDRGIGVPYDPNANRGISLSDIVTDPLNSFGKIPSPLELAGISPEGLQTAAEAYTAKLPSAIQPAARAAEIPFLAVDKTIAGVADWATSPSGYAQLEAAGMPVAKIPMAVKFFRDMAKGAGESAAGMIDSWEKGDYQGFADQLVSTMANTLGAGFLGHHALTKGAQYAGAIRKDKGERAATREVPQGGQANRGGNLQQAAPGTQPGAVDEAARGDTQRQEMAKASQIPLNTRLEYQGPNHYIIELPTGERRNFRGSITEAKAELDRLTIRGKTSEEEPQIDKSKPHLIASAVKDPGTGNWFQGPNHPKIREYLGLPEVEKEQRNDKNHGFVVQMPDGTRKVVGRDEAGKIAKEAGQNIDDIKTGHQLHSDEVVSPFDEEEAMGDVKQPIKEVDLQRGAVKPQGVSPEIQEFSDLFTGKKSGLKIDTHLAVSSGLKVKSIADLDALAGLRRDAETRKNQLVSAFEKETDPEKKAEITKQLFGSMIGQIPREAIEVATNTGSHVEGEGGIPTKHGDRPLDWRTHPEVAEWLKKNAQSLGIKLPKQLTEKPPAEELEPEHQQMLDIERGNVTAPVEVIDTSEVPSDQPFSRSLNEGVATIDRAKGRILINKQKMDAWLKTLPAHQRQAGMRSVLAHEQIHLAVTDKMADAYWKTLTGLEQAINKRRYSGGEPLQMSDTMWGHEALRFRIEQAIKSTPMEFIDGVRSERITARALTLLENFLRKLREVMQTKASQEGMAMVDKALENVRVGKIAETLASGTTPMAWSQAAQQASNQEADRLEQQARMMAESGDPDTSSELMAEAYRLRGQAAEDFAKSESGSPDEMAFPMARPKKRPESIWQEKFVLPGMESQRAIGSVKSETAGVSQPEAPTVPPTERVSAEASGALPRLTGEQLKQRGDAWMSDTMQKLLQAATEKEKGGKGVIQFPKFEDFTAFMKRQQSGVQPGQLFEMWQDLAANQFQDLTGEQLQKIGKSAFVPKTSLEKIKELSKTPETVGEEKSISKKQESLFRRESGRTIWDRPIPDKPAPGGVIDRFRRLEADLHKEMRELDDIKQQQQDLPGIPLLKDEAAKANEKIKDLKHSVVVATKDYKAAIAGQKWRERVISALFRKMVKPVMQEADTRVQRKEVTPDEIRYGDGTKASAYEDVSKVPADSPKLGEMLVDHARRSRDDSASITRRVTVIQNKLNGQVSIVSTYDHPGKGVVLRDPISPTGEHSPLSSMAKRYRFLKTILLDEPVNKFIQRFKDLKDYNTNFGKDAQSQYESATSYEPTSVSEEEFMAQTPGRIERGEGGSFQGPSKREIEETGEGAIEKSERTPMTEPEARAMIEHVINEQGKLESADDVREAMMALAQRPNRQALSGYMKLSRQLQKKNPYASQDELLQMVAQRVYENYKQSKTREEFSRTTMAEGGPETGETPPSSPMARPKSIDELEKEKPGFRAWFSGSKVVDLDGKPIIVFHATNQEKVTYKGGQFGREPKPVIEKFYMGTHFGTAKQTEQFLTGTGKAEYGPAVYPVYLKIVNPKRVSDTPKSDFGGSESWWKKQISEAKSQGHDGIVYKNEYEPDVSVPDQFWSWDKVREQVKRIEEKYGGLYAKDLSARDEAIARPLREIYASLGHDYSWRIQRGEAIDKGKTADSWIPFNEGQVMSAITHQPMARPKTPAENYRDQARKLSDDLFRLNTQSMADVEEAFPQMRAVGKEYETMPAEASQAVFQKLEEETVKGKSDIQLTGNEQKLYDQAAAIHAENNQMYQQLKDLNVPVSEQTIFPRMAKDVNSIFQRVARGVKRSITEGTVLSRSAWFTKHRVIKAIVDNQGNRYPVAIVAGDKGGKVVLYDKGKGVDMGPFAWSDIVRRHQLMSQELEPIDKEAEELFKERSILTRSEGRKEVSKRRIANIDKRMAELNEERQNVVDYYPQDELDQKVWVDRNGRQWRLTDATTHEIESNMDVRYYKEPFSVLTAQNLKLKQMLRAATWLENFKNSPQFAQIARRFDERNIPPTWKRTELPQLRNYVFEPRVADVLNQFHERSRGQTPNILTSTNRLLMNAVFFDNPFLHSPNLMAWWFTSRGAMAWANPVAYGRMVKTGMKAFHDVTTKSAEYVNYLRAGTPLQNTRARAFTENITKMLQDELETNPPLHKKMANLLGYANPIKLSQSIGHAATSGLHDIMTLQLIYELQGRDPNIKPHEAIRKISAIMPDYRIPARVMGSRWISKVFSNPNAVWFGAYHYSEGKAFSNMAKGVVGRGDLTRGEALDKIAATMFLMAVAYPILDQLLKKITGRKDLMFRRAGPATMLTAARDVLTGKRTIEQVTPSFVSPAAATVAAISLFFNKNLMFGGRGLPVYNPKQGLGQSLKNIAGFAGQSLNPIQIYRDITMGRYDWDQIFENLAGIRKDYSSESGAQLYGWAYDWAKRTGNQKLMHQFEQRGNEIFPPSDYSVLKNALADGNKSKATAELARLRRIGKSDADIERELRPGTHPFSGLEVTEPAFEASLSSHQRAVYAKAMEKRDKIYRTYLEISR